MIMGLLAALDDAQQAAMAGGVSPFEGGVAARHQRETIEGSFATACAAILEREAFAMRVYARTLQETC